MSGAKENEKIRNEIIMLMHDSGADGLLLDELVKQVARKFEVPYSEVEEEIESLVDSSLMMRRTILSFRY